MAGQFINSFKFGILAVIALTGPKILTDSGKYFAKIEPDLSSSADDNVSENPPPEERKDKKSLLALLGSRFFHPAEEKEELIGRISDSSPSVSSLTKKDSETHYAVSYPSPSLSRNEKQNDLREKNNQTSFSEGTLPITPLEKILRFDLTPETVRTLWPKVYADYSRPDFLGLRVSVLTGWDNDDLTGALTYYFDKNSLCRIVFNGKTGDAQKIISFLKYRYGMIRQEDESSAAAQIYRREGENQGKKERSEFTVRQVSGFDANHPDGVYEIHIDLVKSD